MFFIIALGMLWLIHGYVAWRIIPTLGFSSSQTNLAYTTVFILSLLPIIPIALRTVSYTHLKLPTILLV